MIATSRARRARKLGASPTLLLGTLTGLCLLTTVRAYAAEYFVAPTGSDANPGSMAQPFATLQKGADVAGAGDTVYLRGGTYSITRPDTSGAGVTFSKSGTSDTNRIKFWAYQGETPIFDFTNMTLSTTGYTHGFVVTGSWLHFRGLELRNVKMNTRSNNAIAANGGGHNIFELLNLHHLAGTGIFIGKGEGGNLILNTDSHDNYDPTSTQGDGQNADGFGVHYQTTGPSTIVRGCRAWWNSDDGYDLISQEVPVIVENSWATGNGYINSGADRPGAGNGNGFKMGSSKTGIRHIIRNNLAWKNAAAGFYANHSSGGNDWLNNTSYNNGAQYNMLASDPTDSSITIILTGSKVHKMRNNIGYPNKNTNMGGVDTAFNTWDLQIVPAANNFVSVNDTGAMGPREPDGSLPNLTFMKLPVGSVMIDKGTDVGLPTVGAAPDLGAFEYGATAVGGSGGGGGSGAGGESTGGASMGDPSGAGGMLGTAGSDASMAGASMAGANHGTAGDVGSTTTAGSTSSSGSVPTNADEGSGCSCRMLGATSRRASPGAVWSGLGVLALLAERRRRHVPSSSAR